MAGWLVRCLALGALAVPVAAWGQFEPIPDDRLGLVERDPRRPAVDWQAVAEAECPIIPSFALCTDPVWIASACGRIDDRRADPWCPRLVQAEQARRFEDRPRIQVLSADTTRDVAGRVRPFGAGQVVREGAGLAAGLTGAFADPQVGGSSVAAELRRRHDGWTRNCAVTSCEEYVREAWYDYVVFEERAAALGDDWRAIFDLVYAADGIANRTLERFRGGAIDRIAPRTRRFRNRFLAHQPWRSDLAGLWQDVVRAGVIPDTPADFFEVHGGVCRYDPVGNWVECRPDAPPEAREQVLGLNQSLARFDAELAGAVQPAADALFPPNAADPWAWHAGMSAALAGVPDERLLWLDERQRAFDELRAERQAVLAELGEWVRIILINLGNPGGDDFSALVAEQRPIAFALVRRLRGLDRAIQAALEEARAAGCLRAGELTPCDWSPRWLAEDLRGRFVEARAEAETRCQQLTANNFSWLHAAEGEQHWLSAAAAAEPFCTDGGAPVPGCVLRQSYVGDTRAVEQYFDTVSAWLASLDFDRDPETGRVIVGRSASDRLDVGSGLFGVNFHFSGSWRLENMGGNRLLADDPCANVFRSEAAVAVDATAFGIRASRLFASGPDGLYSAGVLTPAVGSRASALVDLNVLGNALYTSDLQLGERAGDAYSFYFAKAPSAERRRDETEVFTVGVVPVTVRAGIAGQATLAMNVSRRGVRCDADADPFDGQDVTDTRIEPFVSATAYASAALGIPGASIGVRGDVTLIRLGFPLTVSGGYGGPGAVAPDALSAQMVAAQTLTVLTGSVSLVVELIFDTYTRRLFGWTGPSWTQEVFRDAFFGPLLVLLEAFGEGDARPRRPVDFDPGLVCEVPEPVPDLGLTYFDFDDEHVDLPGRRLQSVAFAADRDDPGAALRWGAAGVQTSRPGVHGQAFAVGPDAALDLELRNQPVVNFTYAVWVNPAATQPGTILSLGDGQGQGRIQLELDEANRLLHTGECGDAFRRQPVSGEFTLEPGRWHHVAVTYDVRETRLSFFIDGRLLRTREGCALQSLGDSRALARPLPGRDTAPFVGLIDDFARWDGVALTPEQVAEVAARGFAGRPTAGAGAAIPAGVSALVAEGFDDRVQLRWTNPPSLGQPGGFARVQIRADQAGPPRSAGQGVVVYEGVGDSAVHAGLAAGQIWHYVAFAVPADGVAIRGPQAVATTVEAPPAPVQDFVALPGLGHAELRWRLPDAPDVVRVVVRRHPLRFPGAGEGVQVYRGRASGVTDEVLDGGTWYYSAFAQDYVGNLSVAAQARAQILAADGVVIAAPPPIEALEVTPGDAEVALTWSIPADRIAERFQVVRREVDGFGIRNFEVRGAPTLRDVGLINGRTYEYTVRAFDRLGRPGAGASALATPAGDPRPRAPLGFRAVEQGAAVRLDWPPAARPGETVVIRRSTQAPPQAVDQGVAIARQVVGPFIDRGVVPGRRYHYSAFTVGADGLGSPPVAASVQLRDDVQAPPAVSDLRAVAGAARVQVLWTPPAVVDLAGVRVTVTALGQPPQVLLDGPGDAALHAPAEPGVRYTYEVAPYDFSGNVGPARSVAATPEAVPGITAEAGPDQRSLAGAWVWLDGAASAGPPSARYSWRQLAGPSVRIVGADRAVARFLAPAAPGEARFELTVRDGIEVDRDQTTVVLGGAAAELPPSPPEARLEVSEFELGLRAAADVVVAHEPQEGRVHLVDPRARAVVGQFPVQAGRFEGLDAGRAGFVSDGRALITLDVRDPAAPALLEPLPIDIGFDGRVVLAEGLAVAFNARTGEIRVAEPTAEGWAVRFDTVIPDGRSGRDLVVVGEHAYVAIAGTEALPEGIQPLELTGDDAVWRAVEAVPGHSITRLVAVDGDLLILGLPADPVAFRLLRAGLDDPTTPGPIQVLDGAFAQPDRFESLVGVAGQLFAVSLARPGLVDSVRLEAEQAVTGAGFPGPGTPAGSFALWPPAAPTELWIAAEGSGAAPGLIGIHRLDVPRGRWWAAGAEARVPTVVAADGSRVLAAGRAGVGGYRLTADGVEELGFSAYPEPLEADPILLVINGAGGAIAERTGPVSARLRRVAVAAGRPNLGDAIDLPFEPRAAWALDAVHVLLDLGFVGYQVYDLSGAAPAPVGDPIGANGQLAAYDPEARELLVWLSEATEYARFDLTDPTAPVALGGGQFLQAPDELMSPVLFLNAPSTAASYVGGLFSAFQDNVRYDLQVGEQPLEAPRRTLPARAPGQLVHRADLQSWALLAGGTLRWWDAPDGAPGARAVGALTLDPPGAPSDGGAFAFFGPGPYGWALQGDLAWIAAGPSGLLAARMDPVRLQGPVGAVRAGDVARWTLAWDPAVGVAPRCEVSAGICAIEDPDAQAGRASVRWELADPGPATLRVIIGHSTAWRIGEARVDVEARP